MKVHFLGTNGWYDTRTGNTVCVLVETGHAYVIFDAGNGFYKIGRYIRDDKPVYLLLSHYHLDHVIGLHALAKFNFKQGLDVYGPLGLGALFKRVINKPYTIALSALPMKVRLHEISGSTVLPRGIRYAPLKHSCVCYGYRLCSQNKTIAYCTDTGLCKNLYSLAKKADLFISECSLKPGQHNLAWPHLNPENAAGVAARSEARKLALLHFDASLYLNFSQRDEALKAARKLFSNSVACKDAMTMEL